MDGMSGRTSLISVYLLFSIITISIMMISVHSSGAACIEDISINQTLASNLFLKNPVLSAGDFQYFDVMLSNQVDKITIIAYFGKEVPDIEDRSSKNYYRWEYTDDTWYDKSGYSKKYIISERCHRQDNVYSFFISLDPGAIYGDWTILVIIDSNDAHFFTIDVDVIRINMIFFALSSVSFEYDRGKLFEKYFSDHKKVISSKPLNQEVDLKRIEEFVDQSSIARDTVSDIEKRKDLLDKNLVKKGDYPANYESSEDEVDNKKNNLFLRNSETSLSDSSTVRVLLKKGNIPPPLKKMFSSSIIRGGLSFFVLFIIISCAFIPLISSLENNKGNHPTIMDFTLYPDTVMAGERIYLNVTIFDTNKVTSATVNIFESGNLDLFVSYNSENLTYWEGSWIVDDFEGNNQANIIVKNEINLTSSKEISWSVLSSNINDNDLPKKEDILEHSWTNSSIYGNSNQSMNTSFPPIGYNASLDPSVSLESLNDSIMSSSRRNNISNIEMNSNVSNINFSRENISSNQSAGQNNVIEIPVEQGPAEIGNTVAWEKRIIVHNNELKQQKIITSIKIPLNATKIKIYDVLSGIQIINFTLLKKINIDEYENSHFKFNHLIFNASLNAGEKRVYQITYNTIAPKKQEINLDGGKRIIIESNASVHYYNVRAFTQLPEIHYKPPIYRIINDTRIDISNNPIYNVTYEDNNSNGYYDGLSWIVPKLSNDTYEIDISIINVQSYPLVGGKWTVYFNTTGTANLTISAVNGTTWSNISEEFDLKFLGIQQGNQSIDYEWINDSVFIENYSSNEPSFITSKVLTPGKHTLQFSFGNDIAFAYNNALSNEFLYAEDLLFYGTSSSDESDAYGAFDDIEAEVEPTLAGGKWRDSNYIDAVIENPTNYSKSFGAMNFSVRIRFAGTGWDDDYFGIHYSIDNGSTWSTEVATFQTVSTLTTFGPYTTTANDWSDVNQTRIRIDYNGNGGPDDPSPTTLYIDGYEINVSYNTAPSISNPYPINQSAGLVLEPICNVTITDPDGGTVTVRFYENTTGPTTWVLQQTNTSVDVSTPANVIWNNYNNASAYATTYWWKVNVSDGNGGYDEKIYHFTTAANVAAIINSYDLRNGSGSRINNASLDVNVEYFFTLNITEKNGWADLQYINLTSWYDNESELSYYNQTGNTGGNLNMFLQYENTTGTANFTMLWPDDEAELISGNCSELIINSTTRIINISFRLNNQVRYANTTGGWNTNPGWNDANSWNFEINITDDFKNSVSAQDEYGIYRYAHIETSQNWVGVIGLPGFNDTSDIVTLTYSSNYDFNITLWFEENLRNQTWSTQILVGGNVDIMNDTDPNDDINTGDKTFSGVGISNKVDLINTSGIFSKDGVNSTVDVRFNVRIPFGTMWGQYTAHIGVKIFQKQ